MLVWAFRVIAGASLIDADPSAFHDRGNSNQRGKAIRHAAEHGRSGIGGCFDHGGAGCSWPEVLKLLMEQSRRMDVPWDEETADNGESQAGGPRTYRKSR